MKSRYAKLLGSVALTAIVALSACDDAPKKIKVPKQQNAAEKIDPVVVPPSKSVAGNYMAARFAIASDDLSSANTYFNRALDQTTIDRDFLTERALPSAIGAGDFETALKLTKEIDLKKPTATSQLAVTILLVDAFKKNNVEQIDSLLPLMRTDGFGRLLHPLLSVWSKVAKDDDAGALADLDRLNKEYPPLSPLVEMHKAFINDYAGNQEEADVFYTKGLENHFSVRSAYVVGQFYERTKQKEKVEQLYVDMDRKIPGSVLPNLVLDRLGKEKYKTDALIKDPKDGVAAALYDVATVLHQEGSSRLAILYAQMAHYLTPNDDFTIMLLGDILSNSGVAKQSEKYFQSIKSDSDLYVLAQLRLAQIYERQHEGRKAISTLDDLKNNPLVKRQVLNEMADIYRMREDFGKAIPYYSEIIKEIETPVPSDWVLFYARGISYERTGEWQKAEVDLLQALKLSPNQPEVLNYLAYSWADHGQNLDTALDMLEKALTGAPEDPYITDSVGWALFKIGRFQDALPFIEIAAQNLPDDATINEHLGDIYWKLNRQLEAQFQWERALKFVSKNDKTSQERIQNKIKSGLTQDVQTSNKE